MSEETRHLNSSSESTHVIDLLNCFQGRFVETVLSSPKDILAMSEQELEQNFTPTTTDFIIRRNIHIKAKQVMDGTLPDKLEPKDVYKDVCTKQNFYRNITNHYRLAWYLIPIQDYSEMIEDSFFYGLKKVREILNMPVTEKSAPHIMKALEFFANRHLGPVVQKIEQKSMNMNVNKTISEREVIDPEEMMQKFAELKSKLATLPQAAVNVDEPT